MKTPELWPNFALGTHTCTNCLAAGKPKAKIAYTQCDSRQEEEGRETNQTGNPSHSFAVSKLLNNLSAICRRTHTVTRTSHTHTHTLLVSRITHTPRVTHRGANEVKWPAAEQQPVDFTLSLALNHSLCALCFALLFRRQQATGPPFHSNFRSLRVLLARRRFSSRSWVQLPLVSRHVRFGFEKEDVALALRYRQSPSRRKSSLRRIPYVGVSSVSGVRVPRVSVPMGRRIEIHSDRDTFRQRFILSKVCLWPLEFLR